MLVIEDGSGTDPAANSYVTVQEIRAYADQRGDELPADDADVEALAVRAVDFLESLRDRYKGAKTSSDQPLQWPREGAFLDGSSIPDDEIPRVLKFAQMAAAVEARQADLMENPTAQGPVEEETVGPIAVRYTNRPGAVMTGPSAFAKPWALISPLLKASGLMVMRS